MSLDARDRAILGLLETDARMPVSHIAKKVRISKDAVAYRMRNMEREGVIRGFYTVLNMPKLGLVSHKVTVKFQNLGPEKESEIVDYLKKTRTAGWIASCDGRWDFSFICWVKSTYEFGRFFTKFLERYGSLVQDKELNIITESHSCKRKYLVPTEPEESVCSGPPSRKELDDVDLEIVGLMADNPRIRVLELAKEVGMVPDSVSRRMNSLVERGVMQKFRPVLDIERFGYKSYDVMVRLNTAKGLGRMFDYLKGHPNVVSYSKYIGTFDVGIDIEIEGPEKLREMMGEMKALFSKEIRNYEPLLVYKKYEISHYPSLINSV